MRAEHYVDSRSDVNHTLGVVLEEAAPSAPATSSLPTAIVFPAPARFVLFSLNHGWFKTFANKGPIFTNDASLATRWRLDIVEAIAELLFEDDITVGILEDLHEQVDGQLLYRVIE